MGDAKGLALQALIVKHVNDVTSKVLKQRREGLTTELGNGDRISVASPDSSETVIGMVYRTKPSGSARVTDKVAFTAWMRENHPLNVEIVHQIATDRWDEAVKILETFAPDLLTSEPMVSSWAEKEVLELTVRARRPCGPQGELDLPGVLYEPPSGGTVTVRLSEEGPAEIERLWRDGRVDLATGAVREITTGGGEDE